MEDVYAAIEEAARLVGAPCSRDKVLPILTAYRSALTEAGIVFTVQTGERRAGELDYTITVPPGGDDPYALALANGFVTEAGHPVDALFSEIQDRCPVGEYLIDCGVVGGFKKIYAHFPQELQGVAQLARIPSMPRALSGHAGFFARHGLDQVAMIAIDYRRKSMNLYFTRLSAECLEPQNILSMLREIGLPEPDEQLMEFARKSFRINVTLSWDSANIVRICCAPPPARGLMASAPPALTARLTPEIEQFVKGAPYTYGGERINLFGVKWAPEEECLDVASYYQVSPVMRKLWMAFYKEQI